MALYYCNLFWFSPLGSLNDFTNSLWMNFSLCAREFLFGWLDHEKFFLACIFCCKKLEFCIYEKEEDVWEKFWTHVFEHITETKSLCPICQPLKVSFEIKIKNIFFSQSELNFFSNGGYLTIHQWGHPSSSKDLNFRNLWLTLSSATLFHAFFVLRFLKKTMFSSTWGRWNNSLIFQAKVWD